MVVVQCWVECAWGPPRSCCSEVERARGIYAAAWRRRRVFWSGYGSLFRDVGEASEANSHQGQPADDRLDHRASPTRPSDRSANSGPHPLTESAAPNYKFGRFRLDPRQRLLTRADEGPVNLTAKAFDALVYLVEHAGTAVTRAELTEALWPRTVVEEHNLNKLIMLLRRALGDGREQRFITTLQGRGYQFVAPVEVEPRNISISAVAPLERAPTAVSAAAHGARVRPENWMLGVAAVAIAVITLTSVLALRRETVDASAADVARAASVAVLPFANLSPNPEDAYFAVGIHEEIVSQLTKLGSIRVASRTSVQSYAGTQKTTPEIARELNVASVLDGTVRYSNGQVLVTAHLSNGAANVSLWSESYRREFSDIFAIQSEIALSVARALKAELLPDERERVTRVPTTSLRAYDLYLSALARNSRNTTDEVLRGLVEVDEALALDPQFAEAWVVKSSLSTVAGYLDPRKTAQHVSAGEHAARRAIELDPQSGKAHEVLAFALFSVNDWVGSERAYRTALSLNVPLGNLNSYPTLQLAVANFEYAREVLQARRQAEPLNPTVSSFLIVANALLDDWAAADSQYELGATLFPDWQTGHNVMMHLRVGHGELQKAREMPTAYPVHAAMIAIVDTPDAALLELRRMYADAAFEDPVSRRTISVWAAYLGDQQLALESMRASAAAQGGNLFYVWMPQYRQVRQSPQFKALLRDLGVVRYWQVFGWPEVCRPLSQGDFVCD